LRLGHLGERPVRLDRVEAGEEVRTPLRDRLHEPGLREAGRLVRDAGVAVRVRRRLRRPAATCAGPRRALADRAADRLLDRRGDFGRARSGDGGYMTTAVTNDQEQKVVD